MACALVTESNLKKFEPMHKQGQKNRGGQGVLKPHHKTAYTLWRGAQPAYLTATLLSLQKHGLCILELAS